MYQDDEYTVSPNTSLFGDYTAICTHPGCPGKLKFTQGLSAKLSPGDAVPYDRSHPEFGKCPVCKRNKMQVRTAPALPEPLQPKGFASIPTI
jgi:Rieske Fe-S protein